MMLSNYAYHKQALIIQNLHKLKFLNVSNQKLKKLLIHLTTQLSELVKLKSNHYLTHMKPFV